jgi:hypothetical protein
MHESVVDLCQMLVQAGALPGEDFSCDGEQSAFYLSERGYALLQQTYPELDWSEVFGNPYDHVEAKISALHQRLGSPFVDNLLAAMGDRLATLPDAAAGHYLYHILTGVEAATGIALYPFLVEHLDLPGQARLEWLLRQPLSASQTANVTWIQDLVLATGGAPEDCQLLGDQVLLTELGWQLMDQVWQGEWDCVPVAMSSASPAVSPLLFPPRHP